MELWKVFGMEEPVPRGQGFWSRWLPLSQLPSQDVPGPKWFHLLPGLRLSQVHTNRMEYQVKIPMGQLV